ncbi:bifunctional (p)ppGpp synthetase/guanosine-3',5'-bis(diphosphate) 3'-pyrophosphohydrolase [Candidatus Woesearchaeota archaeon]|nr:bifunctional (p)ppGpp synthetase/guanosine-3',5'-bis(diphosphate) 3'-pyrophosphohydrolase [Candidatus Woesearchaeota archaeon]
MMELMTLLDALRASYPATNSSMVEKAYEFSRKAHEGQKRASGEDYIQHPLATALILVDLKADIPTITAALLHDVLEDTKVSLDTIRKEFGDEVAHLVEGTTKIKGIQFESKEDYQAENWRKIILATAKDIRVMLIKLADRLHNMQTLKYFREDKQKRIAKETLRIYAPIAEKLGMWSIKGMLEDLSLRYLDPEAYQALKQSIAQKRGQREEKTQSLLKEIEDILAYNHIKANTTGRAKYFYSIYKKMKEENKPFDKIYDLIGFRIIVDTVEECYHALEIIHHHWIPWLDRFKDYIKDPKSNGYQSIHTTVFYEDTLLEIQIRTKEMDNFAEEGVAAHWRYKQTERDKKFDTKISWIKQLLAWKSSGDQELLGGLNIDLFGNEIIVLTPKCDPIALPEGATPIDFAYMVHSDIGNHCSKAKVNGKIVPLDHHLKSGDIVEIITVNNASPSRQWLKFVKTSKARNKIRTTLGIEAEDKSSKKTDDQRSVVDYLQIKGKVVPLKISKCCTPEIGDAIVGFYTKDGKITVHAKNCSNVHTLKGNKQAELAWQIAPITEKGIFIITNNRIGLLADVLKIISEERINVKSVRTKEGKYVHLYFTVEIADDAKWDELIRKLRIVKDVIDVRRN